MTTLDAKIAAFSALRVKRTQLNNEAKKVTEEMDSLSADIIKQMKSLKFTKVTTPIGTCSIHSDKFPQVTNWDKVYKYIHENEYYHLLEKRPSVSGFRELFDNKVNVPGVSIYEKETIHLRNS